MLEGNALDVTVAAHDLAEGDVALRIPEHLVITLSRVFEDEVPLPPATARHACTCSAVEAAVLLQACCMRAFHVHVLCAQTLAELLTSDKLSELACLTLYLMYEKKNGKKSVWYEFIKVRAVCQRPMPFNK